MAPVAKYRAEMKERYIRQFIRRVLLEQLENEVETAEEGTLPKGVWVMLQAGDPRREAVKQELYELVCQTYASIGGHVKVCEPASLDRYRYWMVEDLDEDPEIDVALFGKPDIAGNKMGGAANDGTPAARAAYKAKGAELRSGGEVGGVGNWWGEVSGKPAYALLRRGAPAIEDETAVRTLLAGDDFDWHGDHPDPNAPDIFKKVKGWYTKRFGDGSAHTKILIGSPSL